MKILFLCKKFPYPLKDGESIAVSNLCKELKSLGCDSTLLCMNTSKHYVNISSLPAEYDHFSEIHTVDIDNTIKPLHALASIISGESYHIRRFRSSAFEAKLIEVLSKQHFDIIQLETLYLAPYVDTIRKYSSARIVMRAHNVEHEIWERITSNTGSKLKKWYLKYLTHKLKEYELQQFTSYDYLVTLTERDLAQFKTKGYKNGASAAPIGFDSGMYPRIHATSGSQMSLCFIGSLDWVPNMEGLNWFLTQCWPGIHKKWPGISFHIAGRNTPKAIKDLKLPNVVVHGEIEDAAAFISAHSAMIVPLFSGSGMRVKIVEGMYLGKVVITTSLGKEGIDGEHKSDFLIADDMEGFVAAIEFCLTHPEEVVQIGNRAKETAINQFNSLGAAQQILGIYQALLTYKKEEAKQNFPDSISA